MYSTRTRVHARIPTDILARRSARVGQMSASSRRAERAARAAAGRANFARTGHAASRGEEVRVGVDVRVGPVEF